jgi:hypothetical protein
VREIADNALRTLRKVEQDILNKLAAVAKQKEELTGQVSTILLTQSQIHQAIDGLKSVARSFMEHLPANQQPLELLYHQDQFNWALVARLEQEAQGPRLVAVRQEPAVVVEVITAEDLLSWLNVLQEEYQQDPDKYASHASIFDPSPELAEKLTSRREFVH